VIGNGEGIWNWVHIEDAAAATCAALSADPGVYNVVGDRPVAQCVWFPAFAKFVSASEPPTVTEEEALRDSGPDSVYYATKLRGSFESESQKPASVPSAAARVARGVSKRTLREFFWYRNTS
jgi:hypothetical protein